MNSDIKCNDLCFSGRRHLIERYCSKCYTSNVDETSKTAHCEKCKTKLMFRCLECKKAYRRHCRIVEHVGNGKCPTEQRLCCFICDFVAPSKVLIDDHLKSVHPDVDPKTHRSCAKSGKNFPNNKSLKRHFKICHPESIYSCDLCVYETDHKRKLVQHFRFKHPSCRQSTHKRSKLIERRGTNLLRSYFPSFYNIYFKSYKVFNIDDND